MANEYGKVLLSYAPFSSSTTGSPFTFTMWFSQDPVDYNHVWAFYVSLTWASKEKSGVLLCQIDLMEGGEYMAFGICVETRASRLAPHKIPLQSLGAGVFFANKDGGEIPIYTWTEEIVDG